MAHVAREIRHQLGDGGRGKEGDLPCPPFSSWYSGVHVETCQVSLYIAVSSWSYIHHPLHLALAHRGRQQAHQGHCLWLIWVWRLYPACMQFICVCFSLLSFVLHVGLHPKYSPNLIIALHYFWYTFAFMFVSVWSGKYFGWLNLSLKKPHPKHLKDMFFFFFY